MKKRMKVRNRHCDSCPFKTNKLPLSNERMFEIYRYLLEGTNHICHNDINRQTVCRGGREVQLRYFTAIGIIDEPTDEALKRAMRNE